MKRKTAVTILYLVVALSLLPVLSGCSTQAGTKDLMENISADSVSTQTDSTVEDSRAITDFTVRLFKQSAVEGESILLSPLSVLNALGMTANGAGGNTLMQMEDTFGMPTKNVNTTLFAYKNTLPSSEKYKLHIANSIWFKDSEGFTVEPQFLQTNADYYEAGIFKAAFDEGTLKDMNGWVNNHTDGMIEKMVDKISADSVMYLVNAIAFDAEWQNIYEKDQVRDGVFTLEDGTTRNVELMYSKESNYLEDENATGFIKYYTDRKYAFAALLPNEGVSVANYISTLTGDGLSALLSIPEDVQVNAAIPKFESEYDAEMSGILVGMGMTDAFDPTAADFSGIGHSADGNIYISRVLHKTYIAVDERGTKAGASTAVEMKSEGSAIEPKNYKTVYLDRPFLYMLIDCNTNTPIFIGTMMDIEN